jgi:hypothetical protein
VRLRKQVKGGGRRGGAAQHRMDVAGGSCHGGPLLSSWNPVGNPRGSRWFAP